MENRIRVVRRIEPHHFATEIIHMNPHNKQAAFTRMAGYKNIVNLDMENCNLNDADIQTIAAFLPNNPHLQEIGLLKNFVGAEGVHALAEAAKSLPELQRINLARNTIVDREGGEALTELMQHCPRLINLNVTSNQLKDEGCAAFATGLKTHAPQLQRLTAAELNSSIDGFTALVDAVRDHPSLQYALLIRQMQVMGSQEEVAAAERLAGGEAKNLTAFIPPTPLSQEFCTRNVAAAESAARLLEREPDTLDFAERAALFERWNLANEVAPKLKPPLDKKSLSLDAMRQRFVEHIRALPTSAEGADGLFAPDANGFAPLDNPAIWRNPQKLVEMLKDHGQNLTPEFLQKRTPRGVSFLESATTAARISDLLPALNKAGIQLRDNLLLTPSNQPTELYQRIIDRGDGGKLFSRENWRGAHPSDMRRAADALPPEQRTLVAVNSLSTALGHDQPRTSRGR